MFLLTRDRVPDDTGLLAFRTKSLVSIIRAPHSPTRARGGTTLEARAASVSTSDSRPGLVLRDITAGLAAYSTASKLSNTALAMDAINSKHNHANVGKRLLIRFIERFVIRLPKEG